MADSNPSNAPNNNIALMIVFAPLACLILGHWWNITALVSLAVMVAYLSLALNIIQIIGWEKMAQELIKRKLPRKFSWQFHVISNFIYILAFAYFGEGNAALVWAASAALSTTFWQRYEKIKAAQKPTV